MIYAMCEKFTGRPCRSFGLQLAEACFLMKPWLRNEYRGRWLVLAVSAIVP